MGATTSLRDRSNAAFDAVRRHTERFVDLARSLTPDEAARPVPGLTWSAGQVVVHVQSVFERYTTDRRRAGSHQELADQNDRDVERLGTDTAAAAVAIESTLAQLDWAAANIEPDHRFPFHGGTDISLIGGWGNLLGELLVHGDDVARATGRAFEMPGFDLAELWLSTVDVMGGWLRAESTQVDESWDLDFPFGTVRFTLEHGRFGCDPDVSRRPRHHRIEIDDVASFTLGFPYRRRALTEPVTALLASRFMDL